MFDPRGYVGAFSYLSKNATKDKRCLVVGVDLGHFSLLWRYRIGVPIVTPFLSPRLLRRPVIRLTLCARHPQSAGERAMPMRGGGR